MYRFSVFPVFIAVMATAGSVIGQSEQTGAERVNRAVSHELLSLPYYGVFDHLSFRVDGHTVTISGDVRRPGLKSAAEAAVKNIEDVEAVDNQIEVLPLSGHDDRIRMAVYRSIYQYPTLGRYAFQAVPPIHIIVKNGVVRLEGVVASESDRHLAVIRAKRVSGVFSVVDNLRVENQPS